MSLTKKEWVLLALRATPLDRIHIMKTLFLVWHRSGRQLPGFFQFQPYLYGPCSFEVYSVLESLGADGLVVQPPHPQPRWVNYYLTSVGRAAAEGAAQRAPAEQLELLQAVAAEVSRLGFHDLLRQVYGEAPDFAANSMFRGVVG